jgi:hypothetical protein
VLIVAVLVAHWSQISASVLVVDRHEDLVGVLRGAAPRCAMADWGDAMAYEYAV